MPAVRVYCAGPLFNAAERNEMTTIAHLLIEQGYDVYLPHRDGMEFRLILDELAQRGWNKEVAGQFLHEAIFALDIYQVVVGCQAMVWNLNGRVPDEGAVSEAAIAWTLGKPLVAYMEDARSLIAGRTNPLLAGLVAFRLIPHLPDVITALQQELAQSRPKPHNTAALPPKIQRAISDGERLWQTLQTVGATGNNHAIADAVCQLFAPKQ